MLKASEHLDILEWVQATRANVIEIMKADNNGYANVTNANDIEKAEKIITRVLTEVVNRMSDTTPVNNKRSND